MINKNYDEINCESCILAKQLNVKNKNTIFKANNPLEVYSIIADPIDPIGKYGFKYVINFVGEYYDCTFSYRLKQKSNTVSATEKCIADATPYGKIKFIRRDNGGEYISCEFNDSFIKNKIKHTYNKMKSVKNGGVGY